jgi:hypothetical protein
MSPKSFTFKLTVPRDPQSLSVVGALASHAATYAGLEAATCTDFVTRVESTAAGLLRSPGAAQIQVVVTRDASGLTFAIDKAPVSAGHSAQATE